jgi:DnaK suppressor protein
MTPSKREIIRRELVGRLAAIYRKVRGEIKDVVGGEPVENDPIDEAEEGVLDELRAFESSMEERDRQLAHAIEDALTRLRSDDGFGICVDCGREIPFERLRQVPWTQRCADDEERFEREMQEHHPTL